MLICGQKQLVGCIHLGTCSECQWTSMDQIWLRDKLICADTNVCRSWATACGRILVCKKLIPSPCRSWRTIDAIHLFSLKLECVPIGGAGCWFLRLRYSPAGCQPL